MNYIIGNLVVSICIICLLVLWSMQYTYFATRAKRLNRADYIWDKSTFDYSWNHQYRVSGKETGFLKMGSKLDQTEHPVQTFWNFQFPDKIAHYFLVIFYVKLPLWQHWPYGFCIVFLSFLRIQHAPFLIKCVVIK